MLPPEWTEQSGVMLTWPHTEMSWWSPLFPQIETTFLTIAEQITKREKLIISCFNAEHFDHIVTLLSTANIPLSQVQFYIVPADDVWARDHGPITVVTKNGPKLLDFIFNGWGNKYPATRDNQITRKLHALGAFAHTPLMSVDLVLEGGSIEVDGQGTLLTTSRCLLAKTRNPQLNREQLIQQLHELLGIQRTLWLEHGYLVGDDTDGHIDTLARFTDPHTICYVCCEDPEDEHYAELQAMEEELKNFTDYQGNPYRLIPLPLPKPKYGFEERRLPATYANFLIINDAVLMPTYEDPADNIALRQLRKCFPRRQIVSIPCSAIVENFGSLHCVTMQLPAKVF